MIEDVCLKCDRAGHDCGEHAPTWDEIADWRASVRACVHFVGFRDDRYHNAVKVWGQPDFIHMAWDRRAAREIAPGDTVVFASGPADQAPADRNYSDLKPGGPVFGFC